ncbi:alpha/beta hydrolase family protein [Pseudonocardia phyllosphaerae]|uniref:alpha/beta hydrolase family protein n=1 Tax=Pseudonocardia phyllosphaerae TaxID=3390502 RepID=UPI00397A13CA
MRPVPTGPVRSLPAVSLLAGGLLATGAASIAWHYSTVLLHPSWKPGLPERVLHGGPDAVTLRRTRLSAQPGVWGLRSPAGLSVVGEVLRRDRQVVVRRLLDGPEPAEGPAVLDVGPFDPDPGDRGLGFSEVEIPTELGPAAAWDVPAPTGSPHDDVWAICVHGRGGTRREALRILPTLHDLGLHALVPAYRGDADAPAPPDGCSHLGDTEWRDVEAAVAWARERGARRFVLVGWSMGAAIGGAFLDRSGYAADVAAVVWDAPMLDWRRVLRRQAANRGLPPSLSGVAALFAEQRIGIDLDRFDLLRHTPAVTPPTLLLHSDRDTAVPVALSRDLAASAHRRGWPVTYREFTGTEHTAGWNADPEGYALAVTGFLRAALREG